MPFKSGCSTSLGKSLHEALLQRPLHFGTLNSPAVRKPYRSLALKRKKPTFEAMCNSGSTLRHAMLARFPVR